MDLSAGRWDGPILDNHYHLDKAGRYLDAALDFKRAGGTDLVLVHKPDFNNLPIDETEIRRAYEETIEMAENTRSEHDLRVRVILGPHPAAWMHQTAELGYEVAGELHISSVEIDFIIAVIIPV